jgi:predicted  nucleic acid-binding Zn-ribbon protein
MRWGVTMMKQQEKTTLNELKKMIQILIEENEKLSVAVSELKEEQKKMQEEIKIQNIVLNSLPARTEILN